ncbi:invasion associated locus B family protein [uncultured Thalassospira sp.]|jgi:invasion protein IalB|uniref:invasion associated locus B family protein n=1 Tax=uncultured Thalassospira sp. TaxID=404382 RepID=UPI0030D6FDF4|tara:strand:- start:103 stop:651 length:549 start_codon:yes stop_codon:yes gene_type:complete
MLFGKATMVRCAFAAVGAFMAVAAGTAPAMAQDANNGPLWKKECDDKNPGRCQIGQQVFLQKDVEGKKQTVGRILAVTVQKAVNPKTKAEVAILTMQLPLGVDLRPGIVIKVDQGPEMKVIYGKCTNAGCDAALVMSDELLASMKAGAELLVGFRAWGNEQTQVIKASLTGFTAALGSIKPS